MTERKKKRKGGLFTHLKATSGSFIGLHAQDRSLSRLRVNLTPLLREEVHNAFRKQNG